MVWASSMSAFVNKTITGTVHKTEKVKFKGLSIVYTPLPVPHSLKKFNSALVIGLASSLIGMQYLFMMYSDALYYYHSVTYQMTCR